MELCCRVCLSNNGRMHKLTEIFDDAALFDILTDISGLQIILRDDMPKSICLNCLSQVLAAFKIRHKVIETENFLKTKICDNLIKIEEVQPEEQSEYQPSNYIFEASFVEEKSDKLMNKNLPRTSTRGSTTTACVNEKLQRKFMNEKSLERKNKTPNEMDYKCFICDQIFEKIATKNKHVRSDHAKETTCKLCKKTFKTALAMETHVKFHFRDFAFLCEICSKTFRYKNRLNTHMSLHHGKATQISCDLCGLKTKFKNNMKRHMKSVHMKLREFRCEHCSGHHYTTQEALNSHLYRYHNVIAPVNCPDCQLGFTFVSELRAHKKYRFCSNNPYAPFTKREKGNVEYLEIVKQTGEHICKLCNKSFPTKTKFSMHNYLKHKYSNKCDRCDIVFTNYTSLMRHEKVKHQGQKPFKCEFCSKSFGQKVSLMSHRNTHTGNKTFACAHCSFRSGDHGTVSKHKKKMHPEMMGSTRVFS